jgi:hypothetical protein
MFSFVFFDQNTNFLVQRIHFLPDRLFINLFIKGAQTHFLSLSWGLTPSLSWDIQLHSAHHQDTCTTYKGPFS